MVQMTQFFLTGKVFIVSGKAFELSPFKEMLNGVRFSGFSPYPDYEDVLKGAELFSSEEFGTIVAIGGGSAIDTAKCIKKITGSQAPLIAFPTTAGSGAESTSFAVVYKGGVKHSLKCELPNCVVLMPELLKTLPLYQKKCAFLDALCQAAESWWSPRATEESISYSKKAIELLLSGMNGYIEKNLVQDAEKVMLGANYAGRAINITTTTAPHAMSYKLTTLYNIPHGHAVSLCMATVWEYMRENPKLTVFTELENTLPFNSFIKIMRDFEILPPDGVLEEVLDILVKSVNIERLSNNPMPFDEETLYVLYRKILNIQINTRQSY